MQRWPRRAVSGEGIYRAVNTNVKRKIQKERRYLSANSGSRSGIDLRKLYPESMFGRPCRGVRGSQAWERLRDTEASRSSCGGRKRLLKFMICRIAGVRAEGYLLFAGWVSHRDCLPLYSGCREEQALGRPKNARPQRSRTESRARVARLTGRVRCGREITSGQV